MDSSIKRKLLIYSIASGILYPILLITSNIGIGMPIYAIVQILLVLYLVHNRSEVINKKALLMFIPIFILSLNYFISDSKIFRPFNMIVIFILYSTMVLLLINKLEIKKQGITFILNIIIALFTPIKHFYIPIKWLIEKNNFKKHNNKIEKIIIGILISIPILTIVCALMMSADIIFENTIDVIYRFFAKNKSPIDFYKIIIGLLAGFYLFGLFYIVFNPNSKPASEEKSESSACDMYIDDFLANTVFNKSGDATIVNIILTGVVCLYTIFIFIQFKYLFAGATLPNGYTYAQYARRGFFELLFLSLINIILILITVFTTRKKTYDKANKYAVYTKGLMLYLCFATVILLISSFYRMTLYNNEFGLTRLRILVCIFLGFEMLGLAITFIYILKPKFNIIAVYLAICLVFYLAINMANIDYQIAKANIDIYENGGELDAYYLSTLSADAAPQMKRLLQDKDERTECIIAYYFAQLNIRQIENTDWQSFNLSLYLGIKNKK